MGYPLGEVGEKFRVRSTRALDGKGRERLELWGIDYGPLYRLGGRGKVRQLWQAGGYSSYDGRRSLSFATYHPVEWWVVEARGENVTIVEVLQPKRGKARGVWINRFNEENSLDEKEVADVDSPA